jgi:hypothetical protein
VAWEVVVPRYPSAKDLAKLSKPGRYSVGHGAYLQISATGTRSWVLRYRSGPKGWLPIDAAGNNVADPLPTIDAAAEVLRELALHAPAGGDL